MLLQPVALAITMRVPNICGTARMWGDAAEDQMLLSLRSPYARAEHLESKARVSRRNRGELYISSNAKSGQFSAQHFAGAD